MFALFTDKYINNLVIKYINTNIVSLSFYRSQNMSSPIVSVKQGELRGKISQNRHDKPFYSFQGIPYAKPPVGSLRFKAPQQPEGWSGIRDATIEGDECFARDMVLQNLTGSEDCLFLNVYTPSLPTNKPQQLKPVMVWIHGGGFVSGSSKTAVYGPEFLLTEDIVLVTFNYRLGVLGFLNLDDPDLHVPGNAGLKDMVMALEYVQENILKFSGDPNNVTIFGESAGAAAVHLLYLSPMAKGLFHRAIAQSGCAFNGWAHSKGCSKELAKIIGIADANDKELLQKLQEVTLEDLMKAQDALGDDIFHPADIRLLGPVIEKQSSEPAFLEDQPWKIIASGNFNKVPLMLGYTSREGMLFDYVHRNPKVERFPKDFELMVPVDLGITRGSELSRKIAAKIKEFYANNEDLNEDTIDKDYLMRGDIWFLRGIHMTIRHHLASSNAPIYLYRVHVESSLNIFKSILQVNGPGVCHGDDIGYLFKTLITPPIEPGSLEDKSITRFVKFWTTFAKNGNPNPTPKDPCIDVTWKPCQIGNFPTIDFGENLTEAVNPDYERMQFWDDLVKSNASINQRF